MSKKIKIISFFDENMVEAFLVQYSSIEKNLKSEFEYYIGISPQAKKLLEEIILEKKNINFIVVSEDYDSLKNSLPSHITNFSYARLYMFDLFPCLMEEENLIYADADMIFVDFPYHFLNEKNNIAISNNSINKYETSLKGWKEKLSETKYSEKIEELFVSGNYFNAGLIIINDPQKMEDLFQKCRNKKYDTDDQTLLNYFNDSHIVVSNDTKWNYQFKHMSPGPYGVLHFSGSIKPWKTGAPNHKLSEVELEAFDIYNEYYLVAQSLEYINREIRKLNLVIINHDKEEKFIENIIKTSETILNKYGEYVEIFMLSSKHSNEVKSKLLDSRITFFEMDENFKKFRKLKEFNSMEILNKNDYVQIVDADDIIIDELLPQVISTIQSTYADIIRNSTLKIDPTLYKDKIFYALDWSGVSSNTIFRWGILRKYFEINDYDGILSEDNVRYMFSLMQKKKPMIQDIDIPFYLGVRWWTGKISHSSVHNSKSDYNDSIEIMDIITKQNKEIDLLYSGDYDFSDLVLRKNNILRSWNLGSDYIKSEMKKKIKRIVFEHIREGEKSGVDFDEMIANSIEFLSKFNLFREHGLDNDYIVSIFKSYEKPVINENSNTRFAWRIPGGNLIFDSEKLEYSFEEEK